MNFSFKKVIIVVMTAIIIFFQNSLSNGQITGANVVGHWAGTGLFQANLNGFNPLKASMKMQITQQKDLKFEGRIERNYQGDLVLHTIEGYLDKNMRNILLVDQNTKEMAIGYIASNAIMKLYFRDHKSNEITIYILRKTLTAND